MPAPRRQQFGEPVRIAAGPLPDHLGQIPRPCGEAKLALLAEYHDVRVSMYLYLAAQFGDAMADLYLLSADTAPDPRALFDRFLGWVPVRRTP
jgi:hypothetical protein